MRSKKLQGSGGNYVFHSQSLPIVDVHPSSVDNAVLRSRNGNHPFCPTDWSFLPTSGVPKTLPLNREKFWSTGDFNILIFLNEFRETLEVFRLKFWKEMSYGSFTWGVMPFVGEIQGLMESLARLKVLTELKGKQPYEDTLSISIDSSRPGNFIRGSLEYRLSGFLDFSGIDTILQIYDVLGFHPDINTVWDSLPLSFLADAFLPIGDLLDNFVDEGWVTSALFTGWTSTKFTGEYALPRYSTPVSGWPIKVYERNYLVNALGETFHPPVLLQSELPKIRDLFNFAYISRCYTDKKFVLNRLKPEQRKVFRKLVTGFLESYGGMFIAFDLLAAFESQT